MTNNTNIKIEFDTPILLLVFNRLETTKQVFNQIKSIKPTRLYIASDGARHDKDGEHKQVEKVRDYILNNVDWDCKVETLFRESNMGCKNAVSGAIDWFFDHEEMGIILEDDCIPSDSFFFYCQELLHRYKDDNRIGQIGGFNKGIKCEFDAQYSYFFSRYVSIWGWATWRRAWKNYDINLSHLEDVHKNGVLDVVLGDSKQAKKMFKSFFKVKKGEIDTWDYQWSFSSLTSNLLTIIPTKNLIKNIGFTPNATHTTGKDPYVGLNIDEFSLPLSHPEYIVFCKKYENLCLGHGGSRVYRFKKLLSNILN